MRPTDVRVQLESVDLKPVPDTVTVVPGSDAAAGEPLVGFNVIARVTVKVGVTAAVSPWLPVTVKVYAP
jgi:hypothetical protein